MPAVRKAVLNAIPASVRKAAPAALGLLVVFTAMQLTGLVYTGSSSVVNYGVGTSLTRMEGFNETVQSFRLFDIATYNSLKYKADSFFPLIQACLLGVLAAFGAFLLVVFKGKFNWKDFMKTMLSAGQTAGSVLILMISASTYSKTLSMCGVINLLSNFVGSLNVAPVLVVVIFILILMILGCILDSTSIILLTSPLMVPILRNMGYDLVWWGIVMIIAIETGMITPPFGMNVFAVKSTLANMKGMNDITIGEIFAGSMPYLTAMIIVDLICIFIPAVVTFIPSVM